MLMNALIVGVVLALTKFFDWYGNTMFQRPIFCVPILGALLGHPTEGIVLGAELELVFLGNVSLGGIMPSDFTLGSIFGAAFAIILGSDITAAITLALPISALGTLLYSCIKVVVTSLVPVFESYIEKQDIRGFKRLWIIQLLGFELAYFLLGFLCIYLGAGAVEAFISVIPDWVQNSMTVASQMLPALGMALLMKSLWDKELCPYYFLGFALGAFFLYNNVTGATLTDGMIELASSSTKILSLVQISFVGICVAALIIFKEIKEIKEKEQATTVVVTDESEDFFND